ncbi:KAP family P-loop NTPase fold protein [Pseudodesulfovibrio sediminis]|uniref:KAP NTPase domain-containing protein n=1 Tax=Pseudodesulfovibrio sediminis TaxID=2810563 RepID=A0ABN6ET76_9BACT|nr:P-loop NTPase fold protein [Pseudodesulfovibrio sediminis]BCS89551.1 hypothetical protein PSDVSF_27930 [Pseudodesulfovibrio sediminis]
MWADKDTGNDYINYAETAEIAADIIRDPNMLPLSLGVFGGWGAGKSSMLQLIRKEIVEEETANDSKYIVIEFDAWLFQNYDDARASLMEVIARKLIESAKSDASLLEKANGLLKRVNYLRAIGTTVEIGASLALGIPPLGFFKRGVDAVGNLLSSEAPPEAALEEAKEAAKEGTTFAQSFINGNENTPPQQIVAFREHFAEVLQGLDKTLVVFIDNLDRCLPDVAIETLEAIRLFLFLESTAFVIAADEDMIRASVQRHYVGIDSQHTTDYLDKLIQVPMRVPLLGVQEVQAYTSLLFISADVAGREVLNDVRPYLSQQLMNSWNEGKIESSEIISEFSINSDELKSSLDLSERLAPILTSAPNISGNPRIIKRLLNTIKMRCRLAEKRGMPVDEALLTKLAVFERCTSDKSYELLAKTVLESEKGQPALLKHLESLTDDPNEFTHELPELWKTSGAFLLKWFKLAPPLSERDIRPAVYLSKESVRLISTENGLTKQGRSLFKALLSLKRVTSKAAQEMINECAGDLQNQVMRLLIDELRKVTVWDVPPPGFHGAVVLANTTPNLGEQLILFLNGLPPATVGSWAFPLISKTVWAKEMAAQWKCSEKNPIKPFKLKK